MAPPRFPDVAAFGRPHVLFHHRKPRSVTPCQPTETAKPESSICATTGGGKKAGRVVVTAPIYSLPDDPVSALAAWARETLVVPPGHPLARSADGAPRLRRGLPESRLWGAGVRLVRGEEKQQIGYLRGVGAGPPGGSAAGPRVGAAPWRACRRRRPPNCATRWRRLPRRRSCRISRSGRRPIRAASFRPPARLRPWRASGRRAFVILRPRYRR